MKRVLDTERHAGSRKATEAQQRSVFAVKAELARIGWNNEDIKRIDKKHKVTLCGKTVSITTQDIMSLGMNIRSERNLGQIVDTEHLLFGKRNKTSTPTVGEVVDAVELLTDKERAVMAFVRTLNEDHLMPQLNETSDILMGAPLARDVNYWGLHRDVAKTVRGGINRLEGSPIEDIGSFQPFLGSKIGLRITPFWDQLMSQIQNAAAYNGQAIPMRNARTLLNNPTWQQSMKDAGRTEEMNNLITMFRRIQGTVTDKTSIDHFGQRFLSASGKSILALRPSTMLVQPASVPIAFTINAIPVKYANPTGMKVQSGKEQSARIDKFSAPLWIRHEGGRTNVVTGDLGAADSVSRLIFGKKDLTMEGMHKTDRLAIQEIDKAVQRWVADTTKLEIGSDAFYTEVAHRTEDVVRKTQPMWDMAERSVLSSTPNFALKSMLMFRSAREAMVNQNILAWDNLVKSKDLGAAEEAGKTLGATVLSTVLVRAMKTAIYTGTTAGAVALLDREPKEDLVSGEKFVESVGTDMLGHLPFGQLVAGTIKIAMGRKALNDLDPDALLVAPLVLAGTGVAEFTKAYEAEVIDEDIDKRNRHLIAGVNNIVDALARLKGVPASGVISVTTKPVERALKQPSQTFVKPPKTPRRRQIELEEQYK
jgi:hypothetical protein